MCVIVWWKCNSYVLLMFYVYCWECLVYSGRCNTGGRENHGSEFSINTRFCLTNILYTENYNSRICLLKQSPLSEWASFYNTIFSYFLPLSEHQLQNNMEKLLILCKFHMDLTITDLENSLSLKPWWFHLNVYCVCCKNACTLISVPLWLFREIWTIVPEEIVHVKCGWYWNSSTFLAYL